MSEEEKKINIMFPAVFPPFPPTYANVSLVNRVMKDEISLEFGFLDSLTMGTHKSDELIKVNQVARIIMPHSSAKTLYEQLKSRLEEK